MTVFAQDNFISGKPAYLYDETNPDWLPTLHLGHTKKAPIPTKEVTQRWERKKARRERVEAAQSLLLVSDTSTVEPVPDRYWKPSKKVWSRRLI